MELKSGARGGSPRWVGTGDGYGEQKKNVSSPNNQQGRVTDVGTADVSPLLFSFLRIVDESVFLCQPFYFENTNQSSFFLCSSKEENHLRVQGSVSIK